MNAINAWEIGHETGLKLGAALWGWIEAGAIVFAVAIIWRLVVNSRRGL